jgi:hypothetical protein
MTTKLKKHSTKSEDDENDSFDIGIDDDIIITDDTDLDDKEADPRWDALKGFQEEL